MYSAGDAWYPDNKIFEKDVIARWQALIKKKPATILSLMHEKPFTYEAILIEATLRNSRFLT